MAEGKSDAEVKLILYHWTHSFSSQKVKASAGRAARIGFQHLDSSRWVPPGEARPPRPPRPQPLRAGGPLGQGCAFYGGSGRISLRWKGRDSGTATHEMRQKTSLSALGREASFPGPLESEAEGSAFRQPPHPGFLLLLLVDSLSSTSLVYLFQVLTMGRHIIRFRTQRKVVVMKRVTVD